MRIALTIIFVIVCVAMIILVMMQEGKDAGLGSLSGTTSETYWDKNKGRSRQGKLVKSTVVAAVLFIVIALVLNMNW